MASCSSVCALCVHAWVLVEYLGQGGMSWGWRWWCSARSWAHVSEFLSQLSHDQTLPCSHTAHLYGHSLMWYFVNRSTTAPQPVDRVDTFIFPSSWSFTTCQRASVTRIFKDVIFTLLCSLLGTNVHFDVLPFIVLGYHLSVRPQYESSVWCDEITKHKLRVTTHKSYYVHVL